MSFPLIPTQKMYRTWRTGSAQPLQPCLFIYTRYLYLGKPAPFSHPRITDFKPLGPESKHLHCNQLLLETLMETPDWKNCFRQWVCGPFTEMGCLGKFLTFWCWCWREKKSLSCNSRLAHFWGPESEADGLGSLAGRSESVKSLGVSQGIWLGDRRKLLESPCLKVFKNRRGTCLGWCGWRWGRECCQSLTAILRTPQKLSFDNSFRCSWQRRYWEQLDFAHGQQSALEARKAGCVCRFTIWAAQTPCSWSSFKPF